MDFFHKFGAIFVFFGENWFGLGCFLNGFLFEKEDHWLSADSKLALSTTYPLFEQWMVGVVPRFGFKSLNKDALYTSDI